ncbi:MAG: benzoate-CoA ligase family protein [Candidatus Brocadiia bacterium]
MKPINYPAKLNVAPELLTENVAKRANKVAIYCEDQKVTFKQLDENVNRFANVLKNLGLKPQDRILLILPDRPAFYYAFLGSIKYGVVPIPTNTTLKKEDFQFMLEDSESKAIVTTSDSEAAGIQGKNLKHILLADKGLDELMAKASPAAEACPSSSNDIAFWLYSSGSTGKPKGVPHRHLDILYTADTFAKEVLKITEKDIIFSASKLFFAYGLGNNLSFPLRFGASAVLMPGKPSPENVMAALAKYKPTAFFGVPTLFNSMLKKLDKDCLSSVRICTSAGEALPPEIYSKWKEATGLEALDGIGSTEALHIFISNFPNDVKPGTSGKVVPGYEAKIVDDSGNELGSGKTGYLIIKGQSITPGYWKRPDDNAEKMLPDGWFKTGDMYQLDNGYFSYQGRGDDMLKVGGIWVSPIEIENVLLQNKMVSDCAVVGQLVEGLTKPFAYVVPQPSMSKTQAEAEKILQFVQERLPKYKWPWQVFFVDELPRTSTGKVQRFKLRGRVNP